MCRGLLTRARIEQTLRPAGLDWITALRAPAIRQLAAEGGPLPLAPMLFDDHDRAAAEAGRTSPVAKAKVSEAAQRKASTQRIALGAGEVQPVHSFRTLLGDLATLSRNTVCFGGQKMLTVHTTPTPLQRRALSLLGLEGVAA